MAFNLVESIKSQVTPDIVQGASRYVGAEPAATQRTLDAAIPTVAVGLVRQASSPQGAERLLGVLKSETAPVEGSPSQGNLSELFGDKLGIVTETLSRHTSLGSASVTRLLGLIAPLATGTLGRHVREQQLDANGLQRLMEEQRESVSRYLPSGLTDLAGGTRRGVEESRTTLRPPSSGTGRAVPIVLGLLAVFALWASLRGPRPRGASRGSPVAVTVRLPKTGTITSATGVVALQQALTSDSAFRLPRRLTLPGTAFEPGSAELASISYVELTQLADLLKHHPNARVRIEGPGDSAADPQLSEQRAVTVREALVSRGVNESQVEARGVGVQEGVGGSGSATGTSPSQTHVVLLTR
jgi:hypothetical protein